MSKELEALEEVRDTCMGDCKWCRKVMGEDFCDKKTQDYDTIETALKTNKKKLDVIGEILVDVSKGNYADLNDAIDEIKEVLS